MSRLAGAISGLGATLIYR